MQQHRKQQNAIIHSYQPDREQLFVSLFYNWFIDTQFSENWEFVSDLKKFVGKVSKVDNEGSLSHTLNNNCSDDEKEKLNELQLWWEKEISEKTDFTVKHQIVMTTIGPIIQELFKIATKSKNLTNEEKQELVVLKWKFWKR